MDVSYDRQVEDVELDLAHRAALFAADRHRGQSRKSNPLAVYVTHPLRVAETLARYGFDEQTVAAGSCHDLIEDTSTRPEELRDRFGQRVLDLVLAASEPDKAAPWEQRKHDFVRALRHLDVDATALVVADKVDWHDSVAADRMVIGERVWDSFKRGMEEQRAHFAALEQAFTDRVELLGDSRLTELVARYSQGHRALFADPVAGRA
jgi:(p)ppGpp synthase/HD superfamily hydrolase